MSIIDRWLWIMLKASAGNGMEIERKTWRQRERKRQRERGLATIYTNNMTEMGERENNKKEEGKERI